MKPTEIALKTLTPAQREAITELQALAPVKAIGPKMLQLYQRLVKLGAATLQAETTNVFQIGEGWEAVDVSIQPRKPRGPYGVVTKNISMLHEHEVIPDPPKPTIKRPPAVYSNRSHNEFIDHVLKNY